MALEFNGSTQYVTALDSNDWYFAGGSFSITCRVEFNDRTGYQYFVVQYPSGTPYWIFYKDDIHKCWFANRPVAGGYDVKTDNAVFNADNTLYHVAFVMDYPTPYIYIDGVPQNYTIDGSVNPLGDSSTILGIGSSSTTAQRINGQLFDFRIYKGVALSAEEIKIIYEANGSDNITRGLVGRWLMNEKPDGSTATVASSVIDISGNNHYGSPVASPIYRAAPVTLFQNPIIM